MPSTLPPKATSSAIWSRVVKPDEGTLSREAALAILELDFSAQDQQRVDALSSKAGDGTLTLDEQAELDEYIRVNNELMILQSKARISLKESGLMSK